MPETFQATATLELRQIDGGKALAPAHVLAWLCNEELDGDRLWVCIRHADPDECTCDNGATWQQYKLTVLMAPLTVSSVASDDGSAESVSVKPHNTDIDGQGVAHE